MKRTCLLSLSTTRGEAGPQMARLFSKAGRGPIETGLSKMIETGWLGAPAGETLPTREHGV
jgi:hypothetical protein